MSTGANIPNVRHAEVGIVGTGLAGLIAARQLTAAGASVCVLEARDRIGGRVWTRPATAGALLDLGGQWIGPTQQRMIRLAAELGAETFKTWDTGNNIHYHAGERSVYSGAIPTADRMEAGACRLASSRATRDASGANAASGSVALQCWNVSSATLASAYVGQPLEYVEQSWAEEEYTRGYYTGYMPPGVWSNYGPALRAPIGRIHWAGVETTTVWNGYMEGEAQSGERAAAEIVGSA